MSLRAHRNLACLLLLVVLAGCGGPPDQEICASIVAALPLVYLLTIGVLWLLEQLRRAPDENARSLGRELLATGGGIAVISAVVVAFAYDKAHRPDVRMTVLALGLFGAIALGASLIVWRALRESSYASRILRAAQLGSALGLPCLLLWPLSADGAAKLYLMVVLPMSFVAAMSTPLLLVALLVEAVVRREPRKLTTSP